MRRQARAPGFGDAGCRRASEAKDPYPAGTDDSDKGVFTLTTGYLTGP